MQRVVLEAVVEEADVAGLLRQIDQVLALAQPAVGAFELRAGAHAVGDVDHRADRAARLAVRVEQRHRLRQHVPRRLAGHARTSSSIAGTARAFGTGALQRRLARLQRRVAVRQPDHQLATRVGLAEQGFHRRVVGDDAALRVLRERQRRSDCW